MHILNRSPYLSVNGLAVDVVIRLIRLDGAEDETIKGGFMCVESLIWPKRATIIVPPGYCHPHIGGETI